MYLLNCCLVTQVVYSGVKNMCGFLMIRTCNFHCCKIANLISLLLSEITQLQNLVSLVYDLSSRFTVYSSACKQHFVQVSTQYGFYCCHFGSKYFRPLWFSYVFNLFVCLLTMTATLRRSLIACWCRNALLYNRSQFILW